MKSNQLQVIPVYVDPEPQTTILWVSRHRPLASQIMELKKKLGRVRILQVTGVVPNAESVMEIALQHNAKVIVPVLPLSFIARLVELAKKHGITILFARMEAIAQVKSIEEASAIVAEAPDRRTFTTYADGTIKIHEFKQFEIIKEVKLVTEPW